MARCARVAQLKTQDGRRKIGLPSGICRPFSLFDLRSLIAERNRRTAGHAAQLKIQD
jgi:hypothetical protein